MKPESQIVTEIKQKFVSKQKFNFVSFKEICTSSHFDNAIKYVDARGTVVTPIPKFEVTEPQGKGEIPTARMQLEIVDAG